jgi:hypothetical protein
MIIEPSLADRAMIATLNKPIVVLPGEEIKVFISTPLWMTILVPQRKVPVADILFWRPTDSWFGPSTMTGDLCYSKSVSQICQLAPDNPATMSKVSESRELSKKTSFSSSIKSLVD